MSETEIITVLINISGRVQGVGFRDSLRIEAERHDVNGWVRNRIDGSVEATLQGEVENIDSLIAWCHRGPPGANVKNIESKMLEADDIFIAFTRWPTA